MKSPITDQCPREPKGNQRMLRLLRHSLARAILSDDDFDYAAGALR